LPEEYNMATTLFEDAFAIELPHLVTKRFAHNTRDENCILFAKTGFEFYILIRAVE